MEINDSRMLKRIPQALTKFQDLCWWKSQLEHFKFLNSAERLYVKLLQDRNPEFFFSRKQTVVVMSYAS